MSHFVRIRTQLKERAPLLTALRDLGFTTREGEAIELRTDGREEAAAEIVAATGCEYEIGFRKVGDTYEMIADWYNVERHTPHRRQVFIDALRQRYAYAIVREQARAQNLIVEEETDANGDIVIVLSERG